jgi:hypothetical protein
MRHPLFIASAGVALALLTAVPTAAQSGSGTGSDLAEPVAAGWSFTPAFDYAFVWDSNTLFENVGSNVISEQVHQFKPNVRLGFMDRRSTFSTHYNGVYVQHPVLKSLNSYEQRLGVNATRLLSRRHSWFLRHATTLSPTTELIELVGVPFARVGVHREDLRTGLRSQVGPSTEMTATYALQWNKFRRDNPAVAFLNDGHGHGGNVQWKHSVDPRVALTAEYDFQRLFFNRGDRFNIHNSSGGLEYQISEGVRAFGGIGVSYLGALGGRPARFGPAVQLGVAHRAERADVSVTFSRAFVPSYSFGGTTDNEELTGRLRLPIARRVLVNSSISLRQNEPLESTSGLVLRSVWLHGSVGYLLNDWMRVEAFSSGGFQRIRQPAGVFNRYQFGVQITAASTARIR